jgi:hypothetical protein
MMPPGQACANYDTREGLRTGVFLLPSLQNICPKVPIVVLTNVNNPKTLEKFKEGPLLKLRQKNDCSPVQFAELVEEMTTEH